MNEVNTLFIMMCALLVLLMTPSLAMFYSGMVKRENTLNTIMNCFIVFGVITLQWIIIGYSLAFGSDSSMGVIGSLEHFALEGISGYNDNGVPNILYVVFQMVFALIASAIITGSLVGRVKLGVLVIFLLIWSTLVYDVLAHMIWSENGFLLSRGGLDFAGGGVVHISAGVAGLVGALMVGPRKERVHISTGALDEIAVNAFIVSIVAAASGYLVWVLMEWIIHKRPTILGSLSGLVAGLVGITPGSGYVGIFSAIIVGGISAIVCYMGLSYIKEKLKWDDSLDAFSLHGIGGVWGGIATGLFASAKVNPAATGEGTLGEGLLISGSYHLLVEQLFGIVVCITLSAAASFVIFRILGLFTDLRVDEKVEQEGLDRALHGENAYNLH